MYNFIYYVLYSANIKDGKFTARFQASLITFFALFVHIALVLSVLKRVFRENYENSGMQSWFNSHKSLYLLIMAVFVFLTFKYYNEDRITKILDRYKEEAYPTRPINVIKVILILLIPIVIGGIILSY